MGRAELDGCYDGRLWQTLVRTWRGHAQLPTSDSFYSSRWEELEPVEHRRPVPRAMVEAMCVLALRWGWTRVVCIILITYHGCARPGEVFSGAA